MNLKQKANYNLGNRKTKRIPPRCHVNKPLSSDLGTRQIEEEIRTLKRQIEFILGATKTGLDIIDSEFNVRYIDSEWAKAYGDPTGRKCYEYFMGRKDPCPGCGIIVALRTKKPVVTEEVLVKESNRPIQVTTIPFQNERGEWLVAEVNVDITQLKRAEDALREAYNTSENKVRERTEELARTNEILQADIVERKQAEEALRRSEKEAKRLAQENAIMAEIGQTITSSLDIEEVYDRFAEEVRKLIPFDRIVVNTIDPKNATLTIAYVSGTDVPERRAGHIIPLSGTATAECVWTRSSFLIQTEKMEEIEARYPGLLSSFKVGLRSFIMVPLFSKDEVIGVLSVRSSRPNAYTETDLRLIERIGHQIAGAIANAQLFADRKRAEEALRESEERYRTILVNIEDGYYETNLRGDLTFFNDSLCRMLGYSKDEMMGMSNKQYTDEENRKKLYAAFNQVYRTGKPVKGFDWQVFTKDGRKIFGEVSVSLLKDSKGEPIGFRGIARDITERKQTEEELRTEKQRFEMLLENAPFGMILIDKAGNFKYVNSKFIDLFGYALNDIPKGREWFRKAYPDPDYRHHVIETWIHDSNITEPGENVPRIFTATCKDGTKKTIRFITVQLGRGEYLMSCEDITLVQRAEEEKAALAEQLRQSQKMEAIGRLAGGIAHDFNNLLTVIRGYSQLSLLGLNENEKLRGNLEEIQKATQRASDLTHHLLAFSRRQIMEMKIIDLNALLRDLDKMLHRVIGEDIKLTYLLADEIGKVRVDPGQIEQVILNLAVNARDAMPSGGKLTIETSNAELDEAYAHTHIGSKPGHYVMISVSDTGMGMKPEVRERAFEPFFTTKEKGKGTGLGLSTCYGIVKQSGGNIWAYSEPGRGTTFKIYLPWMEALPKETKDKADLAEMLKGSETILAVEDEIEVRKLVAQILMGQGYTVIEASNGEQAMKAARENSGRRIHLLLTDVVMPGMSGRELAEALGLLHPNMRVLYMSGYTDNAIVHHGVLEEGVNYIQKPFTLDALARKVREVLDQRG